MAMVLMDGISDTKPETAVVRRKRVMNLVAHVDVWSGRLKGPS
jgi:hypothetical protein